jgi:8-oxo-dGTP diphosphatase
MLLAMRVPQGVWVLVKEVARHLLRRPVVGVAAAARSPDGRWLLVRRTDNGQWALPGGTLECRTDNGQWALPGGTLEWGETLRQAAVRELREEAGVDRAHLGPLVGVYSDPRRDARFHAVTVLVSAEIDPPVRPPDNPAEIVEARLFREDELPEALAYGMTEMLADVRSGRARWE